MYFKDINTPGLNCSIRYSEAVLPLWVHSVLDSSAYIPYATLFYVLLVAIPQFSPVEKSFLGCWEIQCFGLVAKAKGTLCLGYVKSKQNAITEHFLLPAST